jgi:hypothetical protein
MTELQRTCEGSVLTQSEPRQQSHLVHHAFFAAAVTLPRNGCIPVERVRHGGWVGNRVTCISGHLLVDQHLTCTCQQTEC